MIVFMLSLHELLLFCQWRPGNQILC